MGTRSENNDISWSDEVYRIFGLQPQEFDATYEAFLDDVHPDDRSAVDEAYSGSIREGRDNYEIEHRIIRKSTEEIRIVHEKCEHFRDKSNRIIRLIGMVQTYRTKKTEEDVKAKSVSKHLQIIFLIWLGWQKQMAGYFGITSSGMNILVRH